MYDVMGNYYDSTLNAYRMVRCFPFFWRWQVQQAQWEMGDKPPYEWQTVKYNLSKDAATAELVLLKFAGQKVLA